MDDSEAREAHARMNAAPNATSAAVVETATPALDLAGVVTTLMLGSMSSAMETLRWMMSTVDTPNS